MTEIQKFYENSTVFVTGVTGFVGKLVLEKLLRSCPNVGKVHVLVRSKKGKSAQDRLKEVFDKPMWDLLKEENQNFRDKVFLVEGDCILPGLGLGAEDRKKLIEEVDLVIHCAATVRFDEKLSRAILTNVRGTRDLVRLAREMKELKAMVYISTAYSNCIHPVIEERFYEPLMAPAKMITLAETFEDDILEDITLKLLKDYPNTYTFSKHLAEGIVRAEGKGLPLAVLRPSIVTSTAEEPLKGYIDQYFGFAGVALALGCGVIRVIPCEETYSLNVVPGDYVVNNILATVWETATHRTSEIQVYNCVHETAMNTGYLMNVGPTYGRIFASKQALWYPFVILTNSTLLFNILQFWLHTLPAHLMDGVSYLAAQKPQLVDMYRMVARMLQALKYFTMRQWTLKNDNNKRIMANMSPEDKELFYFDTSKLDRETYMNDYALGSRIYLLGESMDTLEEAKKKMAKLKMIHYVLLAFLITGACYIMYSTLCKLSVL